MSGMSFAQLSQLLLQGTLDTLYMTLVSTAIAYLIGIPLGVILVITRREGICPAPKTNAVLGTIVILACELLAEVNIALPLFEVRRNIGQYEVCAFGIGEGNADITHAIGEDLLHVRIVRAEFIVVA